MEFTHFIQLAMELAWRKHTVGKTPDPLLKVSLDPLFMKQPRKQQRERDGEGGREEKREGRVEKIRHQLKEEQKCNGKKKETQTYKPDTKPEMEWICHEQKA